MIFSKKSLNRNNRRLKIKSVDKLVIMKIAISVVKKDI